MYDTLPIEIIASGIWRCAQMSKRIRSDKLSPSPWRVSDSFFVIDENNGLVAQTFPSDDFNGAECHQAANARAIAALPRIITLLEDCFDLLGKDSHFYVVSVSAKKNETTISKGILLGRIRAELAEIAGREAKPSRGYLTDAAKPFKSDDGERPGHHLTLVS